MYVQKTVKIPVFLAAVIFLCGCGAMDTILPSAGTYKVNAAVNGIFLDDCSFAGSRDRIFPLFEEPVLGDPDVTGLMIFLKDNKGDIAGWKVIYNIDDSVELSTEEDDPKNINDDKKTQNDAPGGDDAALGVLSGSEAKPEDKTADIDDDPAETAEEQEDDPQFDANYKYGDEIVFAVKSLDKDMPYFPIPKNLPMGRYTIVFNVLSGEEILQKNEKNFFYLADTDFSFDTIQVHLPGVTEVSQLVPRGTVIMLEADPDYDSDSGRLDPYVIWYDGKKIISEGSFSEGAGNLLWKTPEQSGFFSLRAEIFPVGNRQNLTGYQKEISLLVSSKPVDIHLVSEDAPGLMQLYLFEGSLADSKLKTIAERAVVYADENPAKDKTPVWTPSGGTYGLAAGIDEAYLLPKVLFSSEGIDSWQILFRLKPVNDGVIFSAKFGLSDILLNVSKEENNLVLSLISFAGTVSAPYALPQDDDFVCAAVDFSVWPDRLTAQLNFTGTAPAEEPAKEPLSIAAALEGEFEITLGLHQKIDITDSENISSVSREALPAKSADKKRQPVFTALWDEIAVFHKQFTEIETDEDEGNEDAHDEEPPALAAASVNDDSEN